LCLNCKNRKGEVPGWVVIAINEVEVDVAEQLKWVWKAIGRRNYPVRIYCEALKEVKVGDPASPAKSVVKCENFAAT